MPPLPRSRRRYACQARPVLSVREPESQVISGRSALRPGKVRSPAAGGRSAAFSQVGYLVGSLVYFRPEGTVQVNVPSGC